MDGLLHPSSSHLYDDHIHLQPRERALAQTAQSPLYQPANAFHALLAHHHQETTVVMAPNPSPPPLPHGHLPHLEQHRQQHQQQHQQHQQQQQQLHHLHHHHLDGGPHHIDPRLQQPSGLHPSSPQDFRSLHPQHHQQHRQQPPPLLLPDSSSVARDAALHVHFTHSNDSPQSIQFHPHLVPPQQHQLHQHHQNPLSLAPSQYQTSTFVDLHPTYATSHPLSQHQIHHVAHTASIQMQPILSPQMGAGGIQFPPSPMGSGGGGMLSSNGRVILPSGGTPASTPSASGEGSVDEDSQTPTVSVKPAGKRGNNPGVLPGATTNVTPVKDQDGKFPCPHCSKTYLHAKHLKRHLLRHTGDRPYQCALCKDTFSRSDILKRHFQKCSLRRGNPTGVTHLSLAHAHQQKAKEEKERAAAAVAAAASPSGLGVGGLGFGGIEGKKGSGKACDQCVKLKVKCDLGKPCKRCRLKESECTYSRNQKRPGSRDGADCSGVLPPADLHDQTSGILETAGFNFPPPAHPQAHMTQQGHQQSLAITQQQRPKQQTSQNASVPLLPLKLNESSQSQSVYSPSTATTLPATEVVDWQNILAPTFVDAFYQQQPTSLADNQTLDAFFYPITPRHDRSLEASPPFWPPDVLLPTDPSLRTDYRTPMERKCDALIEFTFPNKTAVPPAPAGTPEETPETDDINLKEWITPDNVEQFVHSYFMHFEAHFPLIHRPTFNATIMHDGLLMVIVCIGAVYSDLGITVSQVRRLMDHVYAAITHRVSQKFGPNGLPRIPELEDVQCMTLIWIILTWHGNPRQRELARTKYGEVIEMARCAEVFRSLDYKELAKEAVRDDSSYYTQLPDMNFTPKLSRSWNWLSWVTQERRTRCAYLVFLLDCVYTMYFNFPPKLRTDELRLPLYADDAAWDAKNASTCAAALGVYGDERAKEVNLSGTRRGTQVEYLTALKTLMTPNADFPFGCTNASSKFVLIHGLHIQLWVYQKHAIDPQEMWTTQWLGPDLGVPTPAFDGPADTLRRSFQKWRTAWEFDFMRQYPNPSSRVGFSRDGMPYFYVAEELLEVSDRRQLGFGDAGDPKNAQFALQMLKQAKERCADPDFQWRRKGVSGGAIQRVDASYGVEELTYNMRLLFSLLESEGQGD